MGVSLPRLVESKLPSPKLPCTISPRTFNTLIPLRAGVELSAKPDPQFYLVATEHFQQKMIAYNKIQIK